ncbi:hypothetical protein MLD38_006981 [Melastoma candidum]|uniref:Uncharacterized protein n=1 Tax=Melastoma candidum TaxID=119954 RepID=A0ACB9RTW0_9MYRT|nr:hypothetical protein MLD38_006981 [Melastoma candidum]
MALKKITWRSLALSCCHRCEKTRSVDADEKLLKQASFQRLLLSDVSNPGSGISVDDVSLGAITAGLHKFAYSELRMITHNFSWSNLLGEGGFGPVYKGFIDGKVRMGLEPQPVAIKLLDQNGLQGHKEWLTEILFLGQLQHPHLVKLIGFCSEEEQRVLVYEYMARGSLENQLFRKYSAALSWSIRMRIAYGAAAGLAFLHEADPPVIYRDFKTSNVLLETDFTAKLSDFGLARDGPEDDGSHVSTRIMGTQGYVAPEYITTGHLTTKSDVYSFGVVLLELLTGKKAMDYMRPRREQSLVAWAKPMLRDPGMINRVIDPGLEGQFPLKAARRVALLAHRCLSRVANHRPTMSEVVKVLECFQDSDIAITGPIIYVVAHPTAAEGCHGEDDVDARGNQPRCFFLP